MGWPASDNYATKECKLIFALFENDKRFEMLNGKLEFFLIFKTKIIAWQTKHLFVDRQKQWLALNSSS